ncbi:MAG: hypothetical protein KDM63_09155, partial [Verrucomicrobiae bacterium]|nr:hypothetical protein [Verrucomicrobiae bacterium]
MKRAALSLLIILAGGTAIAIRFHGSWGPWVREQAPSVTPILEKMEAFGSTIKDLGNTLRIRETVPLTEEAYQKWQLPDVTRPWTSAELKVCGEVLLRQAGLNPDSMPSSQSNFGVAMFRQIRMATDQLPLGNPDEQFELFN